MLTRRDMFTLAAATLAAPAALAADREGRPAVHNPLLVSVLTCPRPGGVSYVDGTLAAVDAELAIASRVLVCDGHDHAPARPDGWKALMVPARARRRDALPDNRTPGWAAIGSALARGADLLFLEDDIRPLVPGAFAKMANHRPPAGAAFTSYYHRNRAPGLHDAAAFNMSQAVMIPLPTVQRLWEMRDDSCADGVIGVDLAIAMIGRSARWKFEQTPNLVAHVGTFSAAMPGHRWSDGAAPAGTSAVASAKP